MSEPEAPAPPPSERPEQPEPYAGMADALSVVEEFLLGEAPHLTREGVAAAADVPLDMAMELWRLSGFPHAQPDEVAFAQADVDALRMTRDLVRLGVLSPDRQAALVRTWGRSFARLAEWQTTLLADVALERATEAGDAGEGLLLLADEVLPRVEALQSYIWRRHLASAAARLMSVAATGQAAVPLAVGFVDIVGYTARSRTIDQMELVDLVEGFEDGMSLLVGGVPDGRVIKSLGDAVLFVCPSAADAAQIGLSAVARGGDPDDAFPQVRAGIAYGEVVLRLGDVFGPTVNIASRLTSVARAGTVVCDEGAGALLADDESVELRRLRRVSVKGYSRLGAYAVRPR